MATDAYIQAAAAELEKAATEVKVEADQIRSELNKMESSMRADIDVKDQNIRLKNVELNSSDNPQQAAALTAWVVKMKRDKDNEQKELEQARQNMTQQIKGKEGAMQALKSQAQNLQNMAANFR